MGGRPLRSSLRILVSPPISEYSYSSFTHYLAVNRLLYSTMDFHSTHVFSVNKADTSENFAIGWIINRRTDTSQLILKRQEQTLGDGLQGAG
jgi:hypothetical protein